MEISQNVAVVLIRPDQDEIEKVLVVALAPKPYHAPAHAL
jgi:hypothetical protein